MTTGPAPVQTIVPSPDASAPLSYAQQRLWVLHQLDPRTSAYRIPGALRLEGMLDVSALGQALNAIVARHEALRSTFGMEQGQPCQMVAPFAPFPLPVTDLAATPADTREAVLWSQMEAVIRRPFDLTTDLLLRPALYRLEETTHVLLFVFHHIASDGWSTGVFLRELQALYTAFAQGQPSPLPPLPLQYPAFARRQRRELTDAVLQPQLQYWQQHLAGAPPVLALPLDRPRPPVQTYEGARHWFTLPAPTVKAVQALGRQAGVTPFMTLLAAFATLLSRYSNQQDLVVGSPIANRHQADVEGLIGFFVNTLALRLDLSDTPSFRELLGRVREGTLSAYDHQDLPFERLVEALQPARRLGHHPLFQVMFSLQNMPLAPLTLPGLRVSRLDVHNHAAKFDLTVLIQPRPDGWHGLWEYNTHLFEAATITRMAGHFEHLLAAALSAPDTPLATLPLMPDRERHQVLVLWNDTGAEDPLDEGIHHLFEAQVARTPNAVAVVEEGGSWTFDRLNRYANRLAHELRQRGVGPDVPVGVCLERSAEMVAVLLGILKAGGMYLPLDPSYPASRRAFMLEDSQTPFLLTTAGQIPDGCPAHTQRIDLDGLSLAQQPAGNPTAAFDPGQAAYLVYTSGSTGQPKGVVGLHRGTVNRFRWMWQAYPFAPGEVCCQKTALSFVDAVWEIFGPLLQGVPLVMVPDAVVHTPRLLVEHLARHAVTRIVLVPSLLRALLEAVPDLGARLPRLTYWTASGEALSPVLAARFRQQVPSARLLNLYGSSEVSADVLCHEVQPDDRDEVPIGRPIRNTQVYVLDRHRQPLPIGVIGELYVGGASLARGYHRQPALTDERFVPDPFSTSPGARLYRTGDRGRYRPDGTLLFRGRADDQVKVRGFRIEPGEVEASLRALPGVAEAFVAARHEAGVPDDPSQPFTRLVAWLVPQPGMSLDVAALRTALQGQVPPHLVPSDFVVLPALPLTPNGKVDVQALPNPDLIPAPPTGQVPPRHERERQLVRLFETVLGRTPVGVHDDFFALGGHSLQAMDLLARITRALGVSLPPTALFQAPTVERLARLLAEGHPDSPWTHLVPIQTAGRRPPLFCVHNLGGNVLLYGALARQLGADQPVYGVQGQGLDGRRIAFTTVADMAAAYVEEVRRLQPSGPYHLLSFCLGSRIVLEMAQQLRAAGEAVGLLAFIDGISPALPRPQRPPDLMAEYGDHLGGPIGAREGPSPPRRSARLHRRLRWAYKQLGRLCLALGYPIPAPLRFPYIVDTYRHLLRAYRPHPWPGQVVLFRSSRMAAFPKDLGWGAFAQGGVETHDITGPHRLLDLPYVADLAEALRKHLGQTTGST
jgi:amino acid adenylation domain-containing protein